MKTIHYRLPTKHLASLKKELFKTFAGVTEEATPAAPLAIYDTFDGGLYRKGQTMIQENGLLRIFDIQSGSDLASAAISKATAPRFHWEYPEGSFRDHLSGISGIRALLPLITAKKTKTMFHLLNSDDKTVCRMHLERFVTDEQEAIAGVTLSPIRGYRKEANAAAAILSAIGGIRLSHHPIVFVLEKISPNPADYQAKPVLPLEPDMPAVAAVRMILGFLAGVMQRNEEGIRRDFDTEFLHDFRVAVRRSRSLLTLTKGVVSPEVSAVLTADLRAAGKATNVQRDMDVYILDQGVYEALLPEPLKPAIRPLFTTLRRRRTAALKKTKQFLAADVYRNLQRHINDYAAQDSIDPSDAPQADAPLLALAQKVITSRYRKVVKSGRRISGETPDADIHQLRIECKKLRYALEFFSPLFPPSDMTRLIKQLKMLQDHLGRFNDLAVQQEFLGAYLDRMTPTTAGAIGTAAATGALIGILHQEQRHLRAKFSDVFDTFDSADNAERYQRLTGQKEPSK
jgi:CHAD domain-containing protein